MDTQVGRSKAVTTPPESIQVGKCYLATRLRGGGTTRVVRRIMRILPDGRIQFEQRRGPIEPGRPWPRRGTLSLRDFAISAQREVPCDWTPEREG